MHENRVTYSINVNPLHGTNADYLNIHSMLMWLHLSLIGPLCKVTKAEFLYKYLCVTPSLLFRLVYGHWVIKVVLCVKSSELPHKKGRATKETHSREKYENGQSKQS